MAYEFATVEREGPVTIVTLNRPDVMNALHSPAHHELAQIFDEFAADPDQWVGILTGSGARSFCAGNDLKFQAGGGAMQLPPSGFAGLTTRFDLAKPLIAAVNGMAMGGGFETALACDIILASDTAKFGLPEPRVGLMAGAGGVQRLPRVVGMQCAMSIILTSRHVPAAEAKELGIASEVVAPDTLMDVARNWAAQICEASPAAVQAAKQAAYCGYEEPTLEQAMRAMWSYPAFRALMTSEDAVEGPRAFAAKRKPNWTGRPLPDGASAVPISN